MGYRTRGQIEWDRDRQNIERRFARQPTISVPRPVAERLGEAEGFLRSLRARGAELEVADRKILAHMAERYAVGSFSYLEAIRNLEAAAAARAREIAGAERNVAELREEVSRANAAAQQ